MAFRSYSALSMLFPIIIIMMHDYSHALSTEYACWVYHVASEFFRLPFCNTRVVFVQMVHSSLGDRKIFITHLIFFLSHCCHIVPWLCVWMAVLSYSVIYLHIYSGNTLFPLLRCSLWYLRTIGYIKACRSCSFVCKLHHLIIIIMQAYLRAFN